MWLSLIALAFCKWVRELTFLVFNSVFSSVQLFLIHSYGNCVAWCLSQVLAFLSLTSPYNHPNWRVYL